MKIFQMNFIRHYMHFFWLCRIANWYSFAKYAQGNKNAKICIFAQKRQLTLKLIHGCIVALIWKLWVAKHAPEKLSITLLISTCLLPKIPINKTLHSLLQTPSPYLLLSKCSQTHNTRHAPQYGPNTHIHPLKHAPITNPKTALDIEEIEAGAQKYLK